MIARKMVFAVLLVVFLVSILSFFGAVRSYAQDKDSSSALSAKLDEVVGNQKTIMQELDAIKEELNIIKIRITQNV